MTDGERLASRNYKLLADVFAPGSEHQRLEQDLWAFKAELERLINLAPFDVLEIVHEFIERPKYMPKAHRRSA